MTKKYFIFNILLISTWTVNTRHKLEETAGVHDILAIRYLRISTGHNFFVVYAINNELFVKRVLDLIRVVLNTKGEKDV